MADDVLIPAVPVFGSRELASEPSVHIGRAGPQILIGAGPWTIGLTIAQEARFPDVEAVLARAAGKAHLRLAEADAASILRTFERGLVRADKTQAVTMRLAPTSDGPNLTLLTVRLPPDQAALAPAIIAAAEAAPP